MAHICLFFGIVGCFFGLVDAYDLRENDSWKKVACEEIVGVSLLAAVFFLVPR